MADESPRNEEVRAAPTGLRLTGAGLSSVTTTTAEGAAEGDELVQEVEQLLRETGRRPERLIVLGGGPGGCAAARAAASAGVTTVLVEQEIVGGAPLAWGGVALRVLSEPAPPGPLGGRIVEESPWERAQAVASELRARTERALVDEGVEIIRGRGRLTAQGVSVEADGIARDLGAATVILAVGSSPRVPEWVPAGEDRVTVPSRLLASGVVPPRLTVVGGGAVGLAVGSLYAQLGSRVAMVDAGPRLLADQDEEISVELQRLLIARGLVVHNGCEAIGLSGTEDGLGVRLREGGTAEASDCIVLALGRDPRTVGVGLLTRQIEVRDGRITVDEHLRTSAEDVYAIGDAVHGSGSAQLAAWEGRAVVAHALGEDVHRVRRHVPLAVHCDPPAAGVGLTERRARERGIEVAVGRARFSDCERGSAAAVEGGLAKVVANARHGRLLGVHLVGPAAQELIGEAAVALSFGATAAELAAIAHPMPGYGETLAAAARGATRGAD